MIEATTDELLDYLADVIVRAERFGATVLPPNDAEAVAWERADDELSPDFRSYWAVKALGWHLVSTTGVRNGSAEPMCIDTSIMRGLY